MVGNRTLDQRQNRATNNGHIQNPRAASRKRTKLGYARVGLNRRCKSAPRKRPILAPPQ